MADIHTLIDMLTEYEAGELDPLGKMHLKDELLDVSEQLHNEEILEGWGYDSTTILIKKGKPLPQLYQGMAFESVLLKKQRVIKLMEITGLHRNDDGELLIEALVKKVKEDPHDD